MPNGWSQKLDCMSNLHLNRNGKSASAKNSLYAKLCSIKNAGWILGRALCVLMLLSAPFEKAFSGPNEIPLLDEPRVLPNIEFLDESNNIVSLDKWSGKVVVLNIWATWCTPCRIEMPTLDRLQDKLGGDRFEVVALSIDEAGLEVVKRFFEEIEVKHLEIYIDPTYKAANQLKALGLPATLLIDPKGQELGRLVGPAEWDSPEMIAFFEGIIAAQF